MRKPRRNGRKRGLAFLAAGLLLVLAWPSSGFGMEAGRAGRFQGRSRAIVHPSQSFDRAYFTALGSSPSCRPYRPRIPDHGNTVRMDEPPSGLPGGTWRQPSFCSAASIVSLRATRFVPYASSASEFNFTISGRREGGREQAQCRGPICPPHRRGVGLALRLLP